MRRLRFVLLVVLLAFGAPSGAAAGPDPAAVAAALAQKETAARGKAADELAALARFCASVAAYDDARQAYARALAFSPTSAALKAELAKLKGKKSAPAKSAAQQCADRRTKSLAKCADLLAPVAAAYAQADRSDELARLVALMRAQQLPVDAPLAKLDVVFFEPYLDWRTKRDVEKLEAGWEYADGAWLAPAKVAELDAAHAEWSNPWTISDDVHEVRTTLPLRTARRVLATVASFRRFFVDYFAGEWDLRPPKPKLPVILTGTRAELESRMRADAPGAPGAPPQAAAFYLEGAGEGNPCFCSFEMRGADGSTTKVNYAGLRWALCHEVGHQLSFEFSKHAGKPLTADHRSIWAVEGVAEFLPHYGLAQGSWRLTKPAYVEMCEGGAKEDAFAWCHANVASIPPLDQFMAQSHAQFMTVANYHVAATLAWYLLEGKDRAYRAAFTKLLEAVHQCRDEADTFAKCFEGVDVKALDAEFRAFCAAIEIDR